MATKVKTSVILSNKSTKVELLEGSTESKGQVRISGKGGTHVCTYSTRDDLSKVSTKGRIIFGAKSGKQSVEGWIEITDEGEVIWDCLPKLEWPIYPVATAEVAPVVAVAGIAAIAGVGSLAIVSITTMAVVAMAVSSKTSIDMKLKGPEGVEAELEVTPGG